MKKYSSTEGTILKGGESMNKNKFYKKYLYSYYWDLRIMSYLSFLLFLFSPFIFSESELNTSNDYSVLQAIPEKSNNVPEGWIPYTPTAAQTEIETWLSEGTAYAKVTFTFADSGYQVSDWGIITTSNNEFSVNTQVLKSTDISAPVVTIKSNTYSLGELTPGIYTFILKSWDTLIESKQFNTQPVYVPDDFPTIQSAIDGVLEGGEIIVKEGTYVENIDFNGKNINLHSTDPTNQDVVENTIIYGDGISCVVSFSGTQNENCILSGFTITNGGIGILGLSPYVAPENSKATIQYNIIKNNTSYGYGAGVCFCDGKIQYNTITENYAPSGGGGLYCCAGIIQYNTISNNYHGGLYYCNGTIHVNIIANNSGSGLVNCDGLIQYNTISKNSGTGGAGLVSCNGTIQFNNIWNNIATVGDGGGLSSCNGTIYNNHIWKNSAKQYGGGLYNCDGLIIYNDIWDNSAFSGGGLSHCDLYIVNNIIWLNKAKGFGARGGGLYYCTNLIQNNMIFSNSSDQDGGAISHSTFIQNNTIWGNIAKNTGGGLYNVTEFGTIRNCIIWNNSAPNYPQINTYYELAYSCVQNLTIGGIGNIDSDPLLYDPDMGDLHLTSESPCIDAGMLISYMTDDFEGDTRPYDGTPISRGDGSDYDMGADEYDASPPIVRPEKPTNLSPPDGAINVPFPITLTSSPFPSVIPEDFHLATHWQIDTNENFNSTELKDFFETEKRTSITIPKYYSIFSSNQLFWRVRYLRGDYIWGKWSEPTDFTTIPFGNIIKVPDDVPTIQDAINAAIDGMEIIVSEGTYYENLFIDGKNIILRSTDPTNDEVVKNTIINGNLSGSVIGFLGTETENCKISGFTITNGESGDTGGGINGNSTKTTISYNRIIGNTGGGLYNCDGLIEFNQISHNMGYPEGDFFCGLYGCDGIIRNNTISENYGLGLDSCQGTIQNNLITKNNSCGVYNCDGTIEYNEIRGNIDYHWTLSGGGLYGCNGIIQYNTITENTASQGAGLLSCTGGLIQNNTISDNIAFVDWGGGLQGCSNIKNNIISNNFGALGGGLYNCQNIENNIITNNWAYGLGGSGGHYGGGGLSHCSGIRYNIILGNSASNGGGGLDNCTGIDNNLIYDNQADYGGGILNYGGSSTLRNNTIYANIAYYSGGGIFVENTSNIKMQNCIIWQNSSPNNAQIALDSSYPQLLPEYCCIQEWTGGGTGNITDDPQLIDPDGSDNNLTTWEDNNFHLLYKSPCIDAGMFIEGLTQDFEGNPRPYNASPEPRGDGSDYDIGAYEFIGSTTNAENWMLWF